MVTRVAENPSQKTAHPEKLITGEALYEMSSVESAELVQGVIVHHMPTGHLHGLIESIITTLLFNFVRPRKLGRVFSGEVGIYIQRNPDTIRAADVAFVSTERVAHIKSHSYLDVAPELIVEVMSPNDSWSEVHQKLEEYFSIGVELIWIVDPKLQQIHVYQSLDSVQRLSINDTLTGGSVLPGFEAAVAELFDTEM